MPWGAMPWVSSDTERQQSGGRSKAGSSAGGGDAASVTQESNNARDRLLMRFTVEAV